MASESSDPSVVGTIAVTADDAVAALAATRRSDRDLVLRVTPPFSGRMRARIHDRRGEPPDADSAIHVAPAALFADSAPAHPTPADTADELRADPERTYSLERHHERHAAAVAAWRESVRDHFVDTVSLDASAGRHAVDLTVLG